MHTEPQRPRLSQGGQKGLRQDHRLHTICVSHPRFPPPPSKRMQLHASLPTSCLRTLWRPRPAPCNPFNRTRCFKPRPARAVAQHPLFPSTHEELLLPSKEEAMFCYQCEQTKDGVGCTVKGVCGKSEDTAALQDLLFYCLKGLGAWLEFAHSTTGLSTPTADSFIKAAICATLTNVNFDAATIAQQVVKCDEIARMIESKLQQSGVSERPDAAPLCWVDRHPHPVHFCLKEASHGDYSVASLSKIGHEVGLAHRRGAMAGRETLLGLQEMLAYGLKGMAAYAHHAQRLGAVDPAVDRCCEQALAFLASAESEDAEQVLEWCMRLGRTNFRVMEMLEAAHTSRYGDPTPVEVQLTPRHGKAVLISGHDLHDLELLLRQTEGTGVQVYTHGEMLPAHGYPELRKFPHLAGHYGGAWFKQRREFAEFPGSILVTSNCIVDPLLSYSDRLFTSGEVQVSACQHLSGQDFSPAIARALELPGFTFAPQQRPTVTVGFGRRAVLDLAGRMREAMQAGQLSHIFLVGGCDAPAPTREYYTDVATGVPRDALVLALGCGKFRFNSHDFGSLPVSGLPRLMDLGQCNDAYSALVLAAELARQLHTDVNQLPLSLEISWFEQKAIAVLLTLLSLGVRNVRLGPSLPAFMTPEALHMMVDRFGLRTPDLGHPNREVQDMMRGR